MPFYYPLLSLLSIVLFAWLGHHLATRRNRNAMGWGVAGGIFPPVLLVLLFMRTLTPEEAEEAEA